MFGITEASDPSWRLNWEPYLQAGNIIITKRLTDEMIEVILRNQNRIILHATCTGWGASFLEPNAFTVEKTFQQIKKLLDGGFPFKQLVVRLDPIIPIYGDWIRVTRVLAFAKQLQMEYGNGQRLRLRYSFIDMYPHVKARFQRAKIEMPYTTFNPPRSIINVFEDKFISAYEDCLEFESCAEPTAHALGCISEKDYDILGLSTDEITGTCQQRETCCCCNTKIELLSGRRQCPTKCVYCYWKL